MRLPWKQGFVANSFIAYPLADDTTCIVNLTQSDTYVHRKGWWQWSISFQGDQVACGWEAERQAAADAATAAWPEALAAEPARHEQLQAVADRHEFVMGMIDRAPVAAEIEAASSDELRSIIWHAQRRWAPNGRLPRSDAQLEAVMAACSAQLLRRRLSSSTDDEHAREVGLSPRNTPD